MDKKTVQKLAYLARLDMPEDNLEPLAQEISGIMTWIEQLNSVNTEGVEPQANVSDIVLKLRQDEVTDGNCAKKVLANAPDSTQGFFVVPKVVDDK